MISTNVPDTTFRFAEPVRSVLGHKGRLVWSIGPEASVFDAIALMAEKQVGALMVMERAQVVGVISERDYARKVILRGRDSQSTRVREIMSTPVVSVTESQTIEDCMRLMLARRVRHLPVMSDGRIAGVVSIGDVMRWIVDSQQQTIQHLHNYINGAYPA